MSTCIVCGAEGKGRLCSVECMRTQAAEVERIDGQRLDQWQEADAHAGHLWQYIPDHDF